MVKSIQLGVIQTYTAHWKIKIERMMDDFDFIQKMEKNDKIISCLYKIHLLNHDIIKNSSP